RAGAGELRQAGDGGIDAVEERLLLALRRHDRLDEPVRGRAAAAAGQREQLPRSLAFVHAARLGADLRVGFAEQRIVDGCARARDWPRRLRLAAETAALIELLRLPGMQPLFDLIRVL